VDWLKDYLIIFIVVQLAGESRVWKRMQWMLILAAGILALLSTYQTLTGDYGRTFYGLANAPVHEVTTGYDDHRITGPLEDPNFYGMIMLMAMPIATYRMLTERKIQRRILGSVLFLLIVATILFTYSRGAFLALIVVGILVVRERHYNPYKIGAALLALILIISPFLPAGFSDRMKTITDILPGGGVEMQTESSFRGRSSEAIIAVQMFQDHPFIGVGRGNYALNYLKYSSRLGLDDRLEARQAHSFYLELAAETGVIGIFVFTMMMIVIFMGLRRAKNLLKISNRPDLIPWVTGIQYSLVAYMLASIFLHSDYVRYFWLIIAFAAASSVMAEEQYRRMTERKLATISSYRQSTL
jgi:O-antigen ligase